MRLEDLGWDPTLAYHAAEHGDDALVPGRLATVDHERAIVLGADGSVLAAWRHPVPIVGEDDGVVPAVGDWGLVTAAGDLRRLVALLPRRSLLSRGQATGPRAVQPLAANVDLVLVVTGLNRDFSLRRIERYLALARSGGAAAMVILSKQDLVTEDEARAAVDRTMAAAPGLVVLAVSALTGAGLDGLRAEIAPGRTAVLVGSSGAGKSTLINRLLGSERQQTGAVRASDDRGRHVTTRRELLAVPDGGLVIDTPGLRAVGLVADADAVREVFPEIAERAAECRFNDCTHQDEPGCAVQAAVQAGELDAARLESFQRLLREQASAARRASDHAQRAHDRATMGRYRKQLKDVYRLKGRDE